mgnify:CR=1 FL=1
MKNKNNNFVFTIGDGKIQFNVNTTLESITAEVKKDIENSVFASGVKMYHDDYKGDYWIFDRISLSGKYSIENTRITFLYGENDERKKMYISLDLYINSTGLKYNPASEKHCNTILEALI